MSHGVVSPVESPLLSRLRAMGGTIPALYFSAGSDAIEIAQNSGINNLATFTALLWVRLTSFAEVIPGEFGGFFTKNQLYSAKRALGLRSLAGTVGFYGSRATSTNYVTVESLKLDEWQLIACSFDSTNAVKSVAIYFGSAHTPAVECTYATTTVGSGALTSDAADPWQWGSDTARSFIGALGPCTLIAGRVLSAAEIQDWQFAPWTVLPGAVMLHFPGLTAGRVVDWSGRSNHGTRV